MNRTRLSLVALGLGTLVSCGSPVMDRDRADREDNGVVSLYVHITHGDLGSVSNPIPYSQNAMTYGVDIEVRDGSPNGGQVIPNFNGWVVLSVTPGVIVEVDPAGGSVVAGRNVQLTNGRGSANLVFRRAYGQTRIWAEEDGYVPADPNRTTPPACANGLDDDGDGRTDFPSDYGCAAANDDSERGGSYALGSSEAIFFGSPTIYDVQGGGSTSPLVSERVSITAGTLIVTRLSVNGFWVTDIADRSCPDPANPTDPSRNQPCYNSLFAFNFSLPNGIRPCDQLSLLQGSVQEFVGTTQLGQPAWTVPTSGLWIGPDSGTCPIPDAVPITPAMLNNAQALLEPYESSIVRASGLAFPTIIGPDIPCMTMAGVTTCHFAPGASNCDLNGDGKVDYSNTAESTCGNQCQLMRGCSEWTGWRRFGTLQVDFVDPTVMVATRLEVSPREAIPELDPRLPPPTDPTGFTITGTLKQVGPNWIVEPRCTQDVVLTGAPVPPNQSCLLPRAQESQP